MPPSFVCSHSKLSIDHATQSLQNWCGALPETGITCIPFRRKNNYFLSILDTLQTTCCKGLRQMQVKKCCLLINRSLGTLQRRGHY
jgi:hypothetical protein